MDLTREKIERMTAPQLRKTVKDQGRDPKEFGDGNPDKMRAWLLESIEPDKVNGTSAPKVTKDERTWQETVELRLAMIEQQLGLAHGTKTPPVPPKNKYEEVLGKYVTHDEHGLYVNLTKEQVDELKDVQLDALAELSGSPFESGIPIRIKRQRIREMLAKLDESPKAGAKAATNGKADVASAYKIGDVVRARWGDDEFDPCRVERVTVKRGVATYDIWFDDTEEEGEGVPESDILGRSKKRLKNYGEYE